uniref:Uncharacterized protein n=1 Tax=Anguilla anguilla TaxID=7936 RepID=A0A0E9UH42_ANGAN
MFKFITDIGFFFLEVLDIIVLISTGRKDECPFSCSVWFEAV